MQELNNGPTKAYLSAFGFGHVRSSVSGLLTLVDDVMQAEGHELQTRLQNLMESIDSEFLQYEESVTFVAKRYMLPFLNEIRGAANRYHSAILDRFLCTLSHPKSPFRLEKRYPLHVVGSELHISITLNNEGPGVAQDVRAVCIGDRCRVKSDEATLGDVAPGPFVLPLIIEVTDIVENVNLEVELEWGMVGSVANERREFSIVVSGQRTDLNWDELALKQYYRLEVAYEDDFYGRQDAVRRIVRRLNPDLMQSCYITGQKRVGKSSLARAVESQLARPRSDVDYHALYLECGEIRHASGEATLKELGTRLESFLSAQLPASASWMPQDYSSSLIPLNKLLEQLRTLKPKCRFVVILDEFDDINESLYRLGELASTFFLNLRTLSSRRNLSFVLVGAEKMPYVMTAQGGKAQ